MGGRRPRRTSGARLASPQQWRHAHRLLDSEHLAPAECRARAVWPAARRTGPGRARSARGRGAVHASGWTSVAMRRPAFEDGHAGDDPGRTARIARHSRSPAHPQPGQRPCQPRRSPFSSPKLSRSPSALMAVSRSVQRAQGIEHARGWWRLGDYCTAPRRPRGAGAAARTRHLGQRRVELQLARHPTLPFRSPPPFLIGKGAAGGSL